MADPRRPIDTSSVQQQTSVPTGAFLQAVQQLINAINAQSQIQKANFGKAASGDLSGIYPGPISVISTHLTAPLPLTQGGTGNTTGQPSGAAGGQLAGSYPDPTLATGAAAANVGQLGSDLSGLLPDPLVVGINGEPLGLTTPTAGNLLIGSGTKWVSQTISGDATLSASGVLTVAGGGGGTLGPYATAALGQLPGTATNDSAAAGDIGEEMESVVAAGSALPLSTATPLSITSVLLTPGDWDVWATIGFTGGGTTMVTYLIGCLSEVNNTLDRTRSRWASQVPAGDTTFASLADVQFFCGQDRYSLAAATTLYLVAQASFGTSTCSAYGAILARRRR